MSYIFKGRDKLAKKRAFFYAYSIIFGFRPPCRLLMHRLPLEGVRQRESGTLFLFPPFYKSFKVLQNENKTISRSTIEQRLRLPAGRRQNPISKRLFQRERQPYGIILLGRLYLLSDHNRNDGRTASMNKEHVVPVMAENPYTGKLMNVEPIFRFMNAWEGADELEDIIKHITINAHLEDISCLFDTFSTMGGMYLCLYDLRDMFRELNECQISPKKGKKI